MSVFQFCNTCHKLEGTCDHTEYKIRWVSKRELEDLEAESDTNLNKEQS